MDPVSLANSPTLVLIPSSLSYRAPPAYSRQTHYFGNSTPCSITSICRYRDLDRSITPQATSVTSSLVEDPAERCTRLPLLLHRYFVVAASPCRIPFVFHQSSLDFDRSSLLDFVDRMQEVVYLPVAFVDNWGCIGLGRDRRELGPILCRTLAVCPNDVVFGS